MARIIGKLAGGKLAGGKLAGGRLIGNAMACLLVLAMLAVPLVPGGAASGHPDISILQGTGLHYFIQGPSARADDGGCGAMGEGGGRCCIGARCAATPGGLPPSGDPLPAHLPGAGIVPAPPALPDGIEPAPAFRPPRSPA